MKFLVVTNAPTFKTAEGFSAYAPYVKEMNIWFQHVDEVRIISPDFYPEKVMTERFERQDIHFSKVPFLNLNSFFGKIKALLALPMIFSKMITGFLWADHIHLRCPGNIGLIGCFVQIFFPKKEKTVKYAGNWDPTAKQPWSYRLQKWILKNTFLSRNIKVLVYGQWENQSENIVPFFTASFSEIEKMETTHKKFDLPYKCIFVGSLVSGKRPFFAVKLVENLRNAGYNISLDLYGDGILREEIEFYIAEKKLFTFIKLHGNQKLEVVKEAYKGSNFLILASKSEGWPKAVAEAMFWGAIPLSTSVSCVPWMLGEGSRGILIEPDVEKASVQMQTVFKNQKNLERMSENAQEWSRKYTTNFFKNEIRQILQVKNKN